MNRLSVEQRTQVIKALVEGNSIRATCRMTGTVKGTVIRLLASVSDHIWTVEEIVRLTK